MAVIVTTPAVTEQIVRQQRSGRAARWMHKNFAEGSTSDEAVRYCQEHGIDVIPPAAR